MRKKKCNKLVRDKIPQTIVDQGLAFKGHPCSWAKGTTLLSSKLVEEAKEVEEVVSWFMHICEQEPVSGSEETAYENKLKEELADVLEVFNTIMERSDITLEDVEKVRQQKLQARGGFEKNFYLEWVEDPKKRK